LHSFGTETKVLMASKFTAICIRNKEKVEVYALNTSDYIFLD
jgi:hypothetical protein